MGLGLSGLRLIAPHTVRGVGTVCWDSVGVNSAGRVMIVVNNSVPTRVVPTPNITYPTIRKRKLLTKVCVSTTFVSAMHRLLVQLAIAALTTTPFVNMSKAIAAMVPLHSRVSVGVYPTSQR